MLNFREELSKIKEFKTTHKSSDEKVLEDIFKKLLQYFDLRDVSDIIEGVKLSFSIAGNIIYAKEYKNDNLILVEFTKSYFDASKILYSLEQKLIEYGFERISTYKAELHDRFDIMIKA